MLDSLSGLFTSFLSVNNILLRKDVKYITYKHSIRGMAPFLLISCTKSNGTKFTNQIEEEKQIFCHADI